jgi:hypothetical protein
MITYGTTWNGIGISKSIPTAKPSSRWSRNLQKSLAYMGLKKMM